MPRPRRNASNMGSGSQSWSSGQAGYVLDRLIRERRISPGEINRYLSEMQSEIDELQRRLDSLRSAAGGGGDLVGGGTAAAPRRGRPGRPPGRGPGRPGRPPGRGPGRPRKNAPAGGGESAGAQAGGAKRGRKGRTAITPEQLASRQLQGRYLALIRQIPANKRGQYQTIAKEKGREAAIREMQGVVGK
jgi:hypothetical protein